MSASAGHRGSSVRCVVRYAISLVVLKSYVDGVSGSIDVASAIFPPALIYFATSNGIRLYSEIACYYVFYFCCK